MNRGIWKRSMVLALLSTCAAAPALAQEAPADQSAAKPAAAAQPKDGPGDIIVTANRREQNLQDVSGVVQALGSDQLRKDGIVELRQLQQAVPGLSIANQEGNVEIFIRGVGSANNTELGDPGAAPHLNGTYIPRPRGLGLMFYDLERVEVNKGPQGTLYGRNALAGTLNIITAKPKFDSYSGYIQAEFGNRNSYAAEGAVNIPIASNFAIRAAGYYVNRDYGFRNVSTGAPAIGLKPAGLEENYAGRLSMLWEPTSRLTISVIGDYGKETGTGYPGANIYSAVEATGLTASDLDLRRVVYRGLQGKMTNELWGVQGKIAYDFDKVGMELTGSYRSVDFNQVNASSDGIDYPGRNLATEQYDNFSGNFWQTKSQSEVFELRVFAKKGQRFRWNLGAFYFNEDQQVGYLALADRGYCCYSGTEFTMPDVRGKSHAFYADGTYDVADRLRVLGGIRYTEESKSRYGIGGNWALTLGGANYACCLATRLGTEGFVPALLSRPNFDVSKINTPQGMAQFLIQGIASPGARDTLINQIGAIANGTNPAGNCFTRPDIDNGFVTCPTNTNGGFSYANLTIPGQQVGSAAFKYADWRLGFEYDLSTGHMVYGKVSTGHKAGGFNDSFNGSTVPETYRPEKLIVYEVGSRNTFDVMGRRAVFNLTGFYYDYKDQVFQDLTCINLDTTQTPNVCNGYSLVNRNIGASRLFGAEAEFRVSLPYHFSVDVNAAYLDTRITSGEVADVRALDNSAGGKSPLISLVGNQLPLASKVNVSAHIAQWIDLGRGRFDWQVLANYRSAYYLTQFNNKDVVFLNGTRQTALQAGFPDRQPGFVTLNLGAGYQVNNVRIEAWASNLLNVQASQKELAGSALNIRFLNDARTYGARLRLTF